MKTYIVVDSNNNVVAISDQFKIKMDNCTTYELEENIDHSLIEGYAYKDSKLQFNKERFESRKKQGQICQLRSQREEECFSYINRGDVWYSKIVNTKERKQELENWYQDWLDVTETLTVPEKPSWIK